MKYRRLLQLFCIMTVLTLAFALPSCGKTEDEQSEPPAQSEEQTGGNVSDAGEYSEITHGNMLIEYPSSWTAEKHEYMIYAGKDGSGNPPFYFVEEIGWVESPGNFVTSQMDAFVSKYQNRVAMQPDAQTMEVAGMKLAGFVASYSAVDGTATITHYDFVEVIDDITYHFVCEYVSEASGDQHEDETTYFDFMHAIESFKVKAE